MKKMLGIFLVMFVLVFLCSGCPKKNVYQTEDGLQEIKHPPYTMEECDGFLQKAGDAKFTEKTQAYADLAIACYMSHYADNLSKIR